MPERHPIARIDRCHAVIAPAICAGFTSVTGEHNGLALWQVVRRIAHKASRVTHSGMQAGTGRGIANGHVARRVHSYAGHKSPHAIVIITPVLLLRGRSGEIAAGYIELIPANSSRPARKIEHNCLDRPQGFRAAKILVNDRGHDFVAKSVDELGDTLLRNNREAVGVCPRFDKRIDGNLCVRLMGRTDAKRRIGRVRKIDMEKSGVNLSQRSRVACRAVHTEHHSIPAPGRRTARAEGSGDETVGSAHISSAQGEADCVGWAAAEHAGAVQSIGAHPVERRGIAEQVHHQEIGVLRSAVVPQAQLGIVPQERRIGRVHLEGVEKPPAADRVARLRHTDALIERRTRERGKSKVADHPPIGLGVVHDEWVAVIRIRAGRPGQRSKEGIIRHHGRQRVTIGFVEDSECHVNGFDVMIRADVAIAVGWSTSAGLRRRLAIKGQQRWRHCGCRPPHVFKQCLNERRVAVACRRRGGICSMRITRQSAFFEFFLWRNVRQVPQVLIQSDRPDHPHDVWALRAGSVPRCSSRCNLLRAFHAASLGEQRHGKRGDAQRCAE